MHEGLLQKSLRKAPEPETAEERSRKLGLKTAGGAVGGGAAVAKVGAPGGWIGLAAVLALVATCVVVVRRRDA